MRTRIADTTGMTKTAKTRTALRTTSTGEETAKARTINSTQRQADQRPGQGISAYQNNGILRAQSGGWILEPEDYPKVSNRSSLSDLMLPAGLKSRLDSLVAGNFNPDQLGWPLCGIPR